MSDSEYSEALDVNGQDESEVNQIHMQLLQQQQQQQHLTKDQHPEQNVSYMNYAGSTTSSGESSISSISSDESEEAESGDSLEQAKLNNELFNLPRGLCENVSVFRNFFSLETWHDLPVPVQNHLKQFLPRFNEVLPPHLAAVEQNRTLSMLFNNQLIRFGQSPLMALQQQLEVGNFRPDILKLRENISKSQRRERRFQRCDRLSHMAKQLFISRQRLLNAAYKSSPDAIIKSAIPYRTPQPKPSYVFTDNNLSVIRARKRFYSEISQLAKQLELKDDIFSSDEEAEKSLLSEEMKRDELVNQNSLGDTNETVKTSNTLADRCIYSTNFKKQQNIEDEDALRLQQKTKQTKLNNRNFKEFLREHKRRKITEPTLPEFETSDIRLRDVCARAQMGGNFKRMFSVGKTPGRKPKITPNVLTITTAASSILTTSTTTQQSTLAPSLLVTNPTICNIQLTATTTSTTTTIAKQPITLNTLPPPSLLPPPPKLSEPPALVPIQSKLKKAETTYQIIKSSNKSTQKEYYQTQQQRNLTVGSLNSSLNINQLMSVNNHGENLNLCMDNSGLLSGDHDTFNMLDNEVELQQEEVETFGNTCEETIPAFIINTDLINIKKTNTPANSINIRNKSVHQTQSAENISQPVPKLEPISRTPLINTKQLSASASINTSVTVSELIQETHACYFSLIRDFFCSTPNHRMRYDDLRHKIDVWLRNPITALNEWYSLSENWSSLLKSAINFLVGEFPDLPDEYVPYIEHKVQLNIYQWIGAGRDSDNRLSELCTLWMEKRKLPQDNKQTNISSLLPNEMKFELCSRSSMENDDSRDDEGSLTPPPPPPRCPTNWNVRAATLEEISDFQRQERERFEQPHKAYTYRMFGYESIVGPVKGIYSPLLALSKARGHSMMVGDRPNFVTILTLVRDAMARLPNGEGTRAEISELLKCSQYINRDASENVLQTIVSGALDRMHTEHDPCVRYDPRRKIWIYLHRNRTEEEFERIHQQNQTTGKANKKLTTRKPKLVCNPGSKPTSLADNDNFILTGNTTDSSNSTSPVTGTLLTMPALVPSNPIIVTNTNAVQRQHQVLQQQMLNTNKCPPVPPLKYNIPPSQTGQQQQKSLLKTIAIRAENKLSSVNTNMNKQQQHSFQIPQSKSAVHQNSTPIIVATPQGLQTVHVSNATSVIPAQMANQQQQQKVASNQQQTTNITANLGGKRVTINKPIIINQVNTNSTTTVNNSNIPTSVVPQKPNKSPQQQLIQKTNQFIQNRITLQTNQHQLLTQQQQQSNVIIPISMANNMSLNVHQSSSNVTEPKISNTANTTSIASSTAASINNKQNIIRLVPASNVKSLMNSPNNTNQQIVNRHRIITTAPTAKERPATPQQHQQKSQTAAAIQLLTNNGNAVTVSSGTTSQVGSIVKMSPQQFASLQQKPGQHIIVKQSGVTKTSTAVVGGGSNKPQRVILGNPAIVSHTGQGKNIVLQQIPVANTASSSAAGTLSGGNKIQTINAKNLTPQQQRILIQNLKQQQQQQQQQTINQNQIQFKTVQVVGNTVSAQRTQTVSLGTAAQQTLSKNLVVVSRDNSGSTSQQHNVARILKTTSSQLKSEISSTSTAAGTRVITSSGGQIISLDSLIQKQGGTLRISGTGNPSQTIKSNQQHQHITTNILQKPPPQQQIIKQQQQQQQTQQFAIVSVPNSIISLSNNSSFSVNQRIITTQAGGSNSNTTSLANLDTAKVTPSIVSTGTGRVITATATGTKIITKQAPGAASSSNIRVINNVVNQTANVNLATLQGKQVVLASGKTLNTINKAQQQQQNIVQTQQGSIVISGQTVKLQQGNTNIQQIIQKSGNIITSNQGSTGNQGTPSSQLQTVIMGNQILRVQQIPQIVSTTNRLNVSNTKGISNNMNSSIAATNPNTPKTIFVGSTGQTLRLQPASSQTQTITNKNIIVQQPQQQLTTNKSAASGNATTPNRVVLAVQGGGQIFLSPNFQGANINLKSLQNMKVVSLAQQYPTAKLKETTCSTSSTSPPSASLSSQKHIFKATSAPTATDTNV